MITSAKIVNYTTVRDSRQCFRTLSGHRVRLPEKQQIQQRYPASGRKSLPHPMSATSTRFRDMSNSWAKISSTREFMGSTAICRLKYNDVPKSVFVISLDKCLKVSYNIFLRQRRKIRKWVAWQGSLAIQQDSSHLCLSRATCI